MPTVGVDLRDKVNALTGLRIFAAVWVALYHFRQITPTSTWQYPLIDPILIRGGLGVDLFFVLSGFILSHVYYRTFRAKLSGADFRSFIVSRFARLYPVHIVTFATMLSLFWGQI
jgi:peptidoglycan/LPS O-acetylase OafA/YrhL